MSIARSNENQLDGYSLYTELHCFARKCNVGKALIQGLPDNMTPDNLTLAQYESFLVTKKNLLILKIIIKVNTYIIGLYDTHDNPQGCHIIRKALYWLSDIDNMQPTSWPFNEEPTCSPDIKAVKGSYDPSDPTHPTHQIYDTGINTGSGTKCHGCWRDTGIFARGPRAAWHFNIIPSEIRFPN